MDTVSEYWDTLWMFEEFAQDNLRLSIHFDEIELAAANRQDLDVIHEELARIVGLEA